MGEGRSDSFLRVPWSHKYVGVAVGLGEGFGELRNRIMSLLLRRRAIPSTIVLVHRRLRSSTPPSHPSPSIPASSKPPSLSARLSFVFDQLDALDRTRSSDVSSRDAALRRIQSWRRAAPAPAPSLEAPPPEVDPEPDAPKREAESVAIAGAEVETMSMAEVLRREVELVHPWPEWIELMERLAQQRYFDLGGASTDEGCVASAVPMDLSEVAEEAGFDFSRDWTTVKNACMNFGRDRFDILKSLPRKDLQILVGHGCPSMDPKVVFSAKLIRKLVHLDEGDVCSSCNLRKLCSRGYILTRKEDEARTLDVMRILLIYGFDHVKGTVENKPLLKLKSLKTVVRKLIHEIAKLGAVPIDPSLPPPVIRKPPPKVKQPPPPPKKRVGRDDVEMKKGDWLCPKCDFMNFAKNTCCLQCDAKRPKRQLLPGEWECPRCNFLNYRRNMSCFHCEHDRPSDEYTNSQMQANQSPSRKRLERPARKSDVSSAWNFDFDDNESDGADVAAFECADSSKVRGSSAGDMPYRDDVQGFEDEEFRMDKTRSEGREQKFPERDSSHMSSVGFDDFDDEEDDIDSYEIDMPKGGQKGEVSRMSYSDLEDSSESEEFSEIAISGNSKYPSKKDIAGPADDDKSDDHRSLRYSHLSDSWQRTMGPSSSSNRKGASCSESSDGIISDLDEDVDNGFRFKRRNNQGNLEKTAYSDYRPFPDMDSDIDGRFQFNGRRNRSSENFRDNSPAYSYDRSSSMRQHGRTKWNKNFKGSGMHNGRPSFDRNHKGRDDNGSRCSRRIVRKNWDKPGHFDGDDMPYGNLNRR